MTPTSEPGRRASADTTRGAEARSADRDIKPRGAEARSADRDVKIGRMFFDHGGWRLVVVLGRGPKWARIMEPFGAGDGTPKLTRVPVEALAGFQPLAVDGRSLARAIRAMRRRRRDRRRSVTFAVKRLAA